MMSHQTRINIDRDFRLSTRSNLLIILAFSCWGHVSVAQDDPTQVPVKTTGSQRIATPDPESRMSLEVNRAGYESAYNCSEELAQQAAREYREEADRESPNPQTLAKLKGVLEAAVTISLKNEMLLQKTRLQIAELDLIESSAKQARRESLASTLIERRIADLMKDEDNGWTDPDERTDGKTGRENAYHRVVPDFATPQELLDFLAKCMRETDSKRSPQVYFELTHQDEVQRMAGMLLRAASMLRSAAKVAETFSALSPDGQNAELIGMSKDLATLINDARLEKPARAAQVAYEEISASDLNLFQLIAGNNTDRTSAPLLSADAYSTKLRKAAGVLKNPKKFAIDAIALMAELSSESHTDNPQDVKTGTQPEWQVSSVGDDKAIAIDRASRPSGSQLTESPSQLELIRVGKTWKISSMISDAQIIEIQQGLKASSSSDSKSPETAPAPAEDEKLE